MTLSLTESLRSLLISMTSEHYRAVDDNDNDNDNDKTVTVTETLERL